MKMMDRLDAAIKEANAAHNLQTVFTLLEVRKYITALKRYNESLAAFAPRGNRKAVGLSGKDLGHIRWAIGKKLCTVEAAADALGIDREAMKSAVGAKP